MLYCQDTAHARFIACYPRRPLAGLWFRLCDQLAKSWPDLRLHGYQEDNIYSTLLEFAEKNGIDVMILGALMLHLHQVDCSAAADGSCLAHRDELSSSCRVYLPGRKVHSSSAFHDSVALPQGVGLHTGSTVQSSASAAVVVPMQLQQLDAP